MDQIEAKIAFDVGNNYYGQGNLKKALPYYEKALDLFKYLNNEEKEADTLIKLADLSIEMENTEDALEYYTSARRIYNKKKDLIGEGYALTGIGIIHEMNSNYENSREYYEKAMEMFQKGRDYKRAGIVSSLIGNTYEIQDAVEDALIDYKRSKDLFGNVKDHTRETQTNIAIDKLESERSKVRVSKKQIAFLAVYLVVICVAELATTYYSLQVGLILHSVLIFTLLIHSSLEKSYNFSNLLMSMMAIPLIRIISLSLPLMDIEPLYRFLIISIPLFAASYIIIKLQRLSRIKIGLTWGNFPVQLTIALTGFALGFVEYLILKPEALIPSFNLVNVFIASIIILISTGLAEELLFRGIIQRNTENVFGTVFGLLYASLLFTCLHIGWNSIFDYAFVFFVALFYGFVFQKTRSIFGITLSHGISNSILFLVMPFYGPKIIYFIKHILF